MSIFPYLTYMNYELWEHKMKMLLCLAHLWNFVQEGFVGPHHKRRDALTLLLILSEVDQNILSSILYEFG